LGEFLFVGRDAVLATLFFVTTGLALFAPDVFLTLLLLAATAGFFAAGAAFFEVGATLATGFFADLAARFGFFAITVSKAGPAPMASTPLFKNFSGARLLEGLYFL